MIEDQVLESWFPVGGQPHHFVLTAVDTKSGVVGEGRIEQAKRMGEADFICQFEAVTATCPQATGRPLPDPVDGQDGRFLEGGRKKCTGGVRFVVVGKDQRTLIAPVEPPPDFPREMQFFTQPERHRLAKRTVTGGGEGQVGFQQSFKLGEWFIVEANVVEILGFDARRRQAVFDGPFGKCVIVLFACKPFFLGSGQNLAIAHQGRC